MTSQDKDMNHLGTRLRELRVSQGLLLRQVAAKIEVDTAFLSKMERGERRAKRDHIMRIAPIYNIKPDDLLVLWLADRIEDVVYNEPLAEKAIALIKKEAK